MNDVYALVLIDPSTKTVHGYDDDWLPLCCMAIDGLQIGDANECPMADGWVSCPECVAIVKAAQA